MLLVQVPDGIDVSGAKDAILAMNPEQMDEGYQFVDFLAYAELDAPTRRSTSPSRSRRVTTPSCASYRSAAARTARRTSWGDDHRLAVDADRIGSIECTEFARRRHQVVGRRQRWVKPTPVASTAAARRKAVTSSNGRPATCTPVGTPLAARPRAPRAPDSG